MMVLRVDQASIDNVVSNLITRRDMAVEGGKYGLTAAAEQIFQNAQASVPVSTGALASSGNVSYEETADSITAIISYGDKTINPETDIATESYAELKHEDPDGGKWLEKAMLGGEELFTSKIVTAISSKL